MESKILSAQIVKKRKFNPESKNDRKLAYKFLKTNSWKNLSENGACPYVVEWPYLDIPSMLKDRLLDFYCKNI
jgi:hypothetical protein